MKGKAFSRDRVVIYITQLDAYLCTAGCVTGLDMTARKEVCQR